MTERNDTRSQVTCPERRFLCSDGTLVADAGSPAASLDGLTAGYRAMVRARTFDEKAIALQRTGRIGTYASCLGQEAVGVGIAQMMGQEDVLLPSFRKQAAQLVRGVTMTELLLYWGGDERGSDFAGPRNDFPVCIPVASHMPHAVGVALAMKLRGQRRVAVAVAGDGATSKGDFYEAINMAGVWEVPAIFVVNNNQWAISVPRAQQTAAETLAQKALAAGLPGDRVDGNDLIAVRDAMYAALERARDGGGATVIECVTYRLGDHTTADDASRYRSPEEVAPHWKEEPIARLRNFLVASGAWTKDDERSLIEGCRAEAEAAVEAYLATPAPTGEAMFDHLFEVLPSDVQHQRGSFLRVGGNCNA